MEYLTLMKKLIIVIAVLIVALLITYTRNLNNTIDKFDHNKTVLVIGILSSPENFESRVSIRNTWLNFSSDFSLTYYFVIGKNLCKVHPLDRVSPFSCAENQISLSENVTWETEFSVIFKKKKKNTVSKAGKVNAFGFGFETLRGITVKKLGLLKHVLTYVSDVRVKLRSSDTLKTLASVTITRNLMPLDNTDFVMKSISPISVEQNTELQLIMEFATKNTDLLPNCEDFQWNYSPGVVHYLQLIQYGERKPWPFSSNSCSYVTMNYTITDIDSVRKDIIGKKKREDEWRQLMDNVSRRLKKESDYYGDLMFVDVVDVYRNLPYKLVQFFKRLSDIEFYYILKTDDDSFIDIERVYKQLNKEINNSKFNNSSKSTRKLWWWSKYREFWKVQETGKWREDDYRSAAYPTFPCGGGYVLSRDIVRYLCKNEKDLKFFQGEDVSVGIWLSALKTVQHCSTISRTSDADNIIQERIIKNFGGEKYWNDHLSLSTRKLVSDTCEWTCNDETSFRLPSCNRIQLTPPEMYKIWQLYIRQGFV